MTRYDFAEVREMIMIHVCTNNSLTYFHFESTLSVNLEQIMRRYDLLVPPPPHTHFEISNNFKKHFQKFNLLVTKTHLVYIQSDIRSLVNTDMLHRHICI